MCIQCTSSVRGQRSETMGISTSLVCVLLFIVFIGVEAQSHVNDNCILANGKAGRCVRIENCSSAIDMVRRRESKPVQCGYEGKHPIVCCELKPEQSERAVGEISKRKCMEMHAVLTPAQIRDRTRRNVKSESSNVLAPGIVHGFGVGGVDAKPAEFKHMAALGYGEWPSVTWGCGGSLISEKFVLTAAHCIIHLELGPVKYVRLGELDLNITTDTSRPQDFKVARGNVHPKYKRPSVYHDIAILELSAHAVIDEFVRPGCLNTETNIVDDVWSSTGWGVTSYLGIPANHLQEMRLRPFTREECQAAYALTSKSRLKNGIDFNSQICAGEAHSDTCQGDSGGPLQIRNYEFGKGYTIIGVTSFGKPCGIGNVPSVYTRVSFYIEWIESIVWPQ